MSKLARAQCESDIYHVTARGVGKQVIFEDDRDRRQFGRFLRKRLNEFQVDLYAWCFMQNHIHLLLRCQIETLSQLMERLLSDYGQYFNLRYNRVGHLFQGRFGSKPVEDERQLLATIRYIHQNPLDLGVVDFASYPWSSYREFVGTPFISDTSFPMSLFNSRESFIDFHKSIEANRLLEPGCSNRNRFKTDDEAIAHAKQVLGCSSLSYVAAADKKTRDIMLAKLKADGFTIRQISRLTGISRSVIQRA